MINEVTNTHKVNFPLRCDVNDGNVNKEQSGILESVLSSKHHPEVIGLRKIPWLITGTITWKRYSRRHNSYRQRQFRNDDFNLLLLKTAKLTNNRLKCFGVVSADEFHVSGEIHRHFVIGDAGIKNVNAAELAYLMTNLWTKILHPFDSPQTQLGTADIKPYDAANFGHRGIDYLCKVQRDLDYRKIEKEFRYSDGFWRLLRRLEKNNTVSLN